MSAPRLRMITIALTATIVCGAYVLAGNQPDPARNTVSEPRNAENEELGFTVKVEFKVIHPEDTPTFFTHSTGGEFAIHEDISEPNHEHSFRIDGILALAEDGSRLLLRYEVEALGADLNEGFEAVHGATGSTFLTPGESRTLATLGDAPLQVLLTRED